MTVFDAFDVAGRAGGRPAGTLLERFRNDFGTISARKNARAWLGKAGRRAFGTVGTLLARSAELSPQIVIYGGFENAPQ